MLEFVSYSLEEPKYDVEECQQRGLTYHRIESYAKTCSLGYR